MTAMGGLDGLWKDRLLSQPQLHLADDPCGWLKQHRVRRSERNEDGDGAESRLPDITADPTPRRAHDAPLCWRHPVELPRSLSSAGPDVVGPG